jgi:catechol-2,3-dioxygenase
MTRNEDRKAKLAPGRGNLPPVYLAHVVRRTSRFEEMVKWYQIVLGARVVHSDGMLAFLTYDHEHHRIAIAQIPGLDEQPAMAAGTDHIAFTHADLGDLLYTYARLKREGIEPYWCINHGPTTSMYYKDPDGSRIEFQVDNFPTAEEGNAWMRGGEFAVNPIGVIFDRHAAGALQAGDRRGAHGDRRCRRA